MKKTSIFLGSKGLSQSEANHTANVAKELAATISSEIATMSLHKKTLNDKYGTRAYNHVRVVENLEEKCLQEGNIYALSAWLREGIKAKAEIIASVQSADVEELGFVLPELPKRAFTTALPKEEQMVETLSISERAEYLSCEAKAAHLGKKIHKDGIIPSWKKSLIHTPPVEAVQGAGHSEYLRVDVDPVISLDTVNDLFFKLQKEHREAESRVNYYKAKLHNLFNEETTRVNSENSKVLQDYSSKVDRYNNELGVIQAKADALRATLLREVSDLKVIVPDALQSTLDYVLSYSKK